MANEDPTGRKPSAVPCIYWNGERCTADSFFDQEEITCFNNANCDGFGTCRGCSKYDQGGLKYGQSDGEGGLTQTPMNLRVLNVRARIAPCCFWDGSPDDFFKLSSGQIGPYYESPFQEQSEVAEKFDAVAEVRDTKCVLDKAAPWQLPFTEENPTPYGCNGAKPECPFYTGPKFTEVVDAKMDTGNRITAKQIMELRYYSEDWSSFSNPREVWEERFSTPDIWAWARDTSSIHLPGSGRYDEFDKPLVQKVSIERFDTDRPQFIVSPPKTSSTGTPARGEPPTFPDLVEELFLFPTGVKLLWPRNTSPENPLVRRTFTAGERNIWISALLSSDRASYAVNLTKHPQGGTKDLQFIKELQRNSPEDVIPAVVTGLPGSTFMVPLVSNGDKDTLNHIRIFLDTGAEDGTMVTLDVYVRLVFYHAHVAQTSFVDLFGHPMVDPWVNHFTRFKIGAQVLDLTGNLRVHEVLWNSITTNGRKTMYAVEEQVETDSVSGELSWEPIGCGHVVVTFEDKNINRVFPWKAWDKDSKGEDLYVKIDRSDNDDLIEGEATEVPLELAFASTKGTAVPANIAFFKLVGDEAVQPFDPEKDKLLVRYAYTKYKQGPIDSEDISKLKFPSDADDVITQLVYDVSHTETTIDVEGTFIRAGDTKIHACDQILGNCYTEKARENELLAQTVFFAGGIGEDDILSNTTMINQCAESFNAQITGEFEDGTPVSYAEAVNRLTNIQFWEGEQRYSVFFEDEEGRPIGTKNPAFLLQSAVAQARDVEIRYKWGAHMQHYPTRDGMIILAIHHKPIYATQSLLVRLIQEYDPYCGDHRETTAGNVLFGAFDLSVDEHGPLWYPYKQCLQPTYHADSLTFTNVVEYEDVVEGFGSGKRRYYWERMRFWDQYMPAIINFIPQIGCFWSERTTTLNANRPVVFTGYTKVRSSHPFGTFASDRESIRLSRHWQKRNLEVKEQVVEQEDGGLSIDLTEEFKDLLFDSATGQLKDGAATTTPVWVHINDGLSIVNPASESTEHPFGHLLMQRAGDHTYDEVFSSNRLKVSEVFSERDYTSTFNRNEDGSKIYLPDGTEVNVSEEAEDFLEEQPGSDVRWVFTEEDTGWAWLAEPSDPVRGQPRVTGLFISNPARVLFKKNREPAVHTTEGEHIVTYAPHSFNPDGTISTSASVQLDDGPELLISQTDGRVFILAGAGSPYDPDEHAEEDYTFVLHGNGPAGIGILADGRGLQRYEVSGENFATLAGVNINTIFDIDQLPYSVVDIRNISRLSGVTPEDQEDDNPDVVSAIDDAIKEYSTDESAPVEIPVDFHGHYFVESVVLDFTIGPEYDIPVIRLRGHAKEDGMATLADADPVAELFPPTSYESGENRSENTVQRRTFNVSRRLFSVGISLGARVPDRRMKIENIRVNLRNHIERKETIEVFEPRVEISKANNGTHKPSDLEFYFQRSYPQFSKNYLSGQLSIGDLVQGQDITAIPGTQIKFLGRQIKDIVPHFEFSDFTDSRFPYNNIDITEIPGYVEESTPAGTYRYLSGAVVTSSKGWTLATTDHVGDPLASLVPTDFGPDGIANVFPGNRPIEELQEELYNYGSSLGGDKVTVYKSHWHPKEVDFFLDSGVDLSQFEWTLTLRSTVAPMDRVFRHEDYGCVPSTTNENLDGRVHEINNWQAKGVFHYHCDPRFSWSCLAVVMNKCNTFLFDDYGTSSYTDTDVVNRFTYVFSFPPNDVQSYIASGLINRNEIGGIVGGTGPIGSAAFASVPAPSLSQLVQQYNTNLPPKGPGPFQ